MSLPVPAATVAIINDSADGISLLMVRRNTTLANAAGAWAFPGGRVEDEDYADTDDHKLAAQCAAVRETIEETGLCIDKENLIPFAHWTTPEGPRRRYATWFFLTELSSPPPVRVDGSEIVDYCWRSPKDILQEHRAGNMDITPPGFVTLTRLTAFATTADALAAFTTNEFVHYNPKLIKTATEQVIFYEGDAGYNHCNINAQGERNRIVMRGNAVRGNDWQYQTTIYEYLT